MNKVIMGIASKKYQARTVQMAMYNDKIMDAIGSPLSTENNIVTDKYDEDTIGVKINLEKIIEIYENGLYLSIFPKSAIMELGKDISDILDEYYSNTSFNTRSKDATVPELNIDVKSLKKFYSVILSRNHKTVEYVYNKPKQSGFDLNIEDDMFEKKIPNKMVKHKEIISRTFDECNSLMGSGTRYREKGPRKRR